MQVPERVAHGARAMRDERQRTDKGRASLAAVVWATGALGQDCAEVCGRMGLCASKDMGADTVGLRVALLGAAGAWVRLAIVARKKLCGFAATLLRRLATQAGAIVTGFGGENGVKRFLRNIRSIRKGGHDTRRKRDAAEEANGGLGKRPKVAPAI